MELTQSSRIACGTSAILLIPPHTVRRQDDASAFVDEPDLARSEFVVTWEGERWCCAMGLKSRYAIVASSDVLRVVGPFERLDLGKGYDPGGLEWIEFTELGSDDLLLSYEIGAARIDSLGTVKWRLVHDDLTARVVAVREGLALFRAESDNFAVRLSDGRLCQTEHRPGETIFP